MFNYLNTLYIFVITIRLYHYKDSWGTGEYFIIELITISIIYIVIAIGIILYNFSKKGVVK
jgi:hypothetical protein